jgi:hypothetical protein
MDDNEFLTWAYKMWEMNREERFHYNNDLLSYEEYYRLNEKWLRLKYEELKETR